MTNKYNHNLIIITDSSGSMSEMGKIFIVQNLLYYVIELVTISPEMNLSENIQLYAWNKDIAKIGFDKLGKLLPLNPNGKNDLSVLNKFLDELSEDKNYKILFFGDGNFSLREFREFISWCKNKTNLDIRTIAIGVDANLEKLKELSTNNKTYKPENISTAIKSLIKENSSHTYAITSIKDIKISSSIEPNDEDSWDD